MITEVVEPRWRSCIVAAPGPSLFPVYDGPLIVVQDAWRMLPWADVLYACDLKWWRYHEGTTFTGERWSTHDENSNDKTEAHDKWGVRCVEGKQEPFFSLDPAVIHYNNNSGFQAINLAILFGCKHITLIGFDMQPVGEKSHFFGDHPRAIAAKPNYESWIPLFKGAYNALPDDIRIVNATPNSALDCFPMMTFDEAMHERELYDPDHDRHAHRGRNSEPRSV